MKNIFRHPRCGAFLFVGLSMFPVTNPLLAQWVQTTGFTNAYVRALAVSPDGTGGTNLFAGNDSGRVFRSTNNGASWTSTELTNTYVHDLAVSPDGAGGTNLFAATGDSGVFRSTDNGANWTKVNTGLTNTDVYALAVNDSGHIFAGTTRICDYYGCYGSGVFRSTDNGANWTELNAGLPYYGRVLNLAINDSGHIFAGTAQTCDYYCYGGGVTRSTDNGANWMATGLTNTSVFDFAASGTSLFAGSDGDGVLLSTNNGTSWTAVNTGLTNTNVLAFAVSGGNLFAGTGAGIGGGGVWRRLLSEIIATAPPSAPANLLLKDSSSGKIGIIWRSNTDFDFLRYRIYRATSPNPTTRVDSTTGGAGDTSKTFAGLTNGTRYYLRVTAVDSGGNESAYSNEVNGAPNVGLAVEVLKDQIPKEYSLSQNYPNPFNPGTNIVFSLPAASFVSLKVYDMLGREVSTIVNESLTAGVYKGTFYGTGLPSGVYFYRLRAGDFVETKKLILQK